MTVRARLASTLAPALVLAALPAIDPPQAQGNEERGRLLAETCLGCHGSEGYFNAYPSYQVPKLGGQSAAYVVAALRAYKNGRRAHETMHAQAATLSDEDMQALADWVSRAGATPAQSTNPPQQAQTCAACHGANGISTVPNYPNLAGQHADYLMHTLRGYRSGDRQDPVMAGLAAPLSEADIRLLAEYYARLPGLQTLEP